MSFFDVAECLARVRKRDQDAATFLVDYLHPVVVRIVRRKLPRGAAEEDLLQEIFLKMFEKLDQYRGEVPFEHWVSRIAVNHCLNAIRFQKARPEWRMADLSKEEEAALEPNSIAPDSDPAYRLGSQEVVENILGKLNPEDRVFIRLLDLEGFSLADVEQTTGRSSAYIRVRACRARRKLNKRFARLKKKEDEGFGTGVLSEGLATSCQ
ncbi:MAG TPA: sigma-70 family RNA polymerase sigma factor [Verrucomicrobiae bacterium]|nr:sigma-70 family RNA polymerase sigma factor [Verrucomicrobiae bacterium]